MRLDKRQKDIVRELSIKYKLTEEQIAEIIESPFIFIRSVIKNINVNEVKTEEEFKLKTKNFNIPCIGKLYANYYNFKKIKERKK